MILKTPRFLITILFKRACEVSRSSYRSGQFLSDTRHRLYWKKLHKEFIPPIMYLIKNVIIEIGKYIFLSKVQVVNINDIRSNFDDCRGGSNLKILKTLQEAYSDQYDFIKLIEDIDKEGLKSPIILWDKPKDRDYYRVKDGNHRVMAMQFLNDKKFNMQKVLIFKDKK